MLFEFGDITVDIDVEGTRNYYNKKEIINDCSCSGCRNYRQYTKICNEEIFEFFDSLGIPDMNYITEIIPIDTPRDAYEKEHGINYMGFYHVKGEILKKKKAKFHQGWIGIAQNFKVRIKENCDLVSDDFPLPCLQVEISALIPWLLNEENEYITEKGEQ